VAAMAVAMIGPMPGTLARRWLTGLLLYAFTYCAGISRTSWPSARNSRPPLKWADRYDPFYQPGFEQKFNTLRRNILEMEAKAEAERTAD
jgi:hypothetical protein